MANGSQAGNRGSGAFFDHMHAPCTLVPMEKLDASDRRRTPRLDKAFPVFVSGDRGVGFGVARNISTGGMFVETLESEPIGTHLRVTFAWPGSSAEMSVEAEVRYASVRSWESGEIHRAIHGMGLAFLRFLPRDDDERLPKDPAAYH